MLSNVVPVQLSFLYWCVIDGGVWVWLGFVCGIVWVRGVGVSVEGDGVMIVGLFWRREEMLILSILVEGWGQSYYSDIFFLFFLFSFFFF